MIDYIITRALQLIQALLPLLSILCSFGQGIVHVFMNRIDGVSTDESIPAETSTIHRPYGQWRSIKLPCSGSSSSKNFIGVLKFGFFFEFAMTEE